MLLCKLSHKAWSLRAVSSEGKEETGRSGQPGKEGVIRPCKGPIPAAQHVPLALSAARTGRGKPGVPRGQI